MNIGIDYRVCDELGCDCYNPVSELGCKIYKKGCILLLSDRKLRCPVPKECEYKNIHALSGYKAKCNELPKKGGKPKCR